MAGTIINKTCYYCFQNVGRSLVLRNSQSSGFLFSYFAQTGKLNTLKVSRLLSYIGCVERNNGTLVAKNNNFGSCLTLSTNIVRRKLTGTIPSSNNEVTIDVQNYFLDFFSKEESLSPQKKDTYMNIIDIFIKSHVDSLPSDILEDISRQVSPGELYNLGSIMYSLHNEIGYEVVVLAYPIFKLAASLGNVDAKYTYGQYLLYGKNGEKPDPVEAAKLFKEAAKENHGMAMYALAGIFHSGYGVEQSFEKCHTFYQAAAENRITKSFNGIGLLYLNGQGVDKDEVTAMKYLMMGAEAGDPHAYMSLGYCYTHGKGVEVDFKKMFEFHKKAADIGHVAGMYNIGTHYFAGQGVDQDMIKAAECFQKASDRGWSSALINLGNMYFNGLGVEKNLEKAKECYQKCYHKHSDAGPLLQRIKEEEEKLLLEQNKDNKDVIAGESPLGQKSWKSWKIWNIGHFLKKSWKSWK